MRLNRFGGGPAGAPFHRRCRRRAPSIRVRKSVSRGIRTASRQSVPSGRRTHSRRSPEGSAATMCCPSPAEASRNGSKETCLKLRDVNEPLWCLHQNDCVWNEFWPPERDLCSCGKVGVYNKSLAPSGGRGVPSRHPHSRRRRRPPDLAFEIRPDTPDFAAKTLAQIPVFQDA